MNPQPTVSVIVPNFNHAPYLEARLDSIFRQTYTDYEVILLDDASTDGSRDILERYARRPRVSHLVVNPQNTGNPFHQWFKGIGLARGRYVWLAESDDVAHPDFLARTVACLDACPQAAYAYTGSVLIDPEGHPLPFDSDRWRKERFRRQAWHAFDGTAYALHNLYWRSYVANASSALFRRASYDRADVGACLGLPHSGDWLFWFRLALTGDVVEVYEKLNYFRQHPQKVTVQAEASGEGKREDIEIVRLMEQALPPISRYRRAVRHGFLYSKIRKLPVSPQAKAQLYAEMRAKLHAGRADFCLERLNRWLRFVWPWAVSMKRDRLLP